MSDVQKYDPKVWFFFEVSMIFWATPKYDFLFEVEHKIVAKRERISDVNILWPKKYVLLFFFSVRTGPYT